MLPDDKKTIKKSFQDFLNIIEKEPFKVMYCNYENNKLKIALWNEETQIPEVATFTFRR